jgi:hypothetical protein
MVARTLVFTEHDLARMRQRDTTPGPKGPRKLKAGADHD